MRYIVNADGYLTAVSFGGEIECGDDCCTEYTGRVPIGCISLVDWYADECERLHRWKVVDGNLTKDTDVPERRPQANVQHYPKLTQAQKDAIRAVADSYEVNGDTFHYDFDATRNDYANNLCRKTFGDLYRFGLCCSTFVENVWMGRLATDFVGKTADTYTNKFTPAFDWGYYFQYKNRRAAAGLAERDADGNITGYYNYVQPNADSFVGSYSTTTNYDAGCTDLTKYPRMQWFRSFMTAADMAQELWELGCEVPFDELDIGDLVFIKSRGDKSTEADTFFGQLAWRNIVHVALVYGKSSDGTLWFMDCTPRDPADSIFMPSMGSSYASNVVEAVDIIGSVVMCARHPAAWCKNNMDGSATQIDYVPMAYCTGYTTEQAIPFGESLQGLVVTEGLWYVDVSTNRLGVALFNGKAMKWGDGSFETKFSNAT